MVIHIYLNASYISEPDTQSKVGVFFFLGPKSNTPIESMLPENVPVHVECSIMINVMDSGTDA